MGLDIIRLLIDYRTSIKFFYPVSLLVILTLSVTLHSRKYKKREDEEVIKKVDIKIEKTDFLKELNMIRSGNLSGYLDEIQKDMQNAEQLMKNYKLMVKKYNKYKLKSRTASRLTRNHMIRMKDYCLQSILDDYENMKKIKMDLINEGVYEEWKKQKMLEK
jgi:hypothetical protein